MTKIAIRNATWTALPKTGAGRSTRRFTDDTAGNTTIEYALMLAGMVLGGTGLASAIGGGVGGLLDSIANTIGLETCLRVFDACIGK